MQNIKFEIQSEYQVLSSIENQLVHYMISLETPPVVEEQNRLPISLVMVIDKSKSMYGEKLEAVIEAASALINWLTRKDYVGIVAYDSNVELVQPLIPLSDKLSIIRKIKEITAGSSTNLSGGWLQGLSMLKDAQEEKTIKRIILLTDGMANTGIVNPLDLKKIAKDHFEQGITTTTMGVGRDFSESVLKEIADSGGGNFYFIEGPDETNEIFFKEFGNLAALYGQGLNIRMNLKPGIIFQEMLSDIPHKINNQSLTIQVGDLRSDDIRNFIFIAEVDGKIASKNQNLIEAEISFYNVQNQLQYETKKTELKQLFSANVNSTNLETHLNKKVRVETIIVSASKTLLEVSKLVAERDLISAKDMILRLEKRIEENLSLDPVLLKRLMERIIDVQHNLEKNISIASKKIMAGAYELSDSFTMKENISISSSNKKVYELLLENQLDLYKCPELKIKIKQALDNGFRYFIFDMTQLNYVDSSGIGTLIQISNWIKNRNGILVFTNVQGNVEKIFEITKLNEIFIIKDSLASGKILLQELMEQNENL